MNRQGNGRTTKEGTRDLKFQNFALPKNRSWTRLGGGAPGQSRTMNEPLRDDERTFGTVLDGVRGHRDDAYEDPELHVVDIWPSSKLLPARPIKDSEYADTRYFSGAVHPSTLLHAKTSIPTEGQAWNPQTGLEEVIVHGELRAVKRHLCKDRDYVSPSHCSFVHIRLSTEIRETGQQTCFQGHQKPSPKRRQSHEGEQGRSSIITHLLPLPLKYKCDNTGLRCHLENTSWKFGHDSFTASSSLPCSSHRPPAILPKKYQPLPPEPENLRPCSRPHTFPDAQREPRQISLKDLSQALEAEKHYSLPYTAPHHQATPEPSLLTQNQAIQEIPLGVPSSSFMVSSHGVQNRDRTGSLPSSIQRCQSSASYHPRENGPPCEPWSRRKPCPTVSEQKDVQHSEWYIGQYGRQAVEEALMKERKDGTFLVRDCSKKSKAEPYVLVVFYGNKVYNVKIRFLERNQQFALGTGLRGDERFDSVEDIIQYYKSFPIILIDGKDKTGVHKEQCCLTRPLPLSRHFSPW
ncbi:cytokine-dependent hematopoietic cell linker [Ochotona princeps]|uniref:cytokine-dependent hematopoietic cell linker n=1 Tax=Ochotona princeps TaxID=9978 RepID=UPI00271484D3|nr:cytokine-dependent hematopoietic cell linker [Ochotona princeps]